MFQESNWEHALRLTVDTELNLRLGKVNTLDTYLIMRRNSR